MTKFVNDMHVTRLAINNEEACSDFLISRSTHVDMYECHMYACQVGVNKFYFETEGAEDR